MVLTEEGPMHAMDKDVFGRLLVPLFNQRAAAPCE